MQFTKSICMLFLHSLPLSYIQQRFVSQVRLYFFMVEIDLLEPLVGPIGVGQRILYTDIQYTTCGCTRTQCV